MSGTNWGSGMRAAMLRLSRALGHPATVEARPGQSVEAALIELAAERLSPGPLTDCDMPDAPGVTVSEYLAKVEADPRRAAALQRARERAPGAAGYTTAEFSSLSNQAHGYGAAAASGVRDTDRVKRLQAAIEGECDGLAVDEPHARAILAYVDGVSTSQPSASTKGNEC